MLDEDSEMEIKMRIVYSILHYETTKITIACIESVLQLLRGRYDANILVVDNGSPNKSGNILREKYKNNNKVRVLILERNLGFAQGNNVGYLYAKENMGANAIIIMNNDIIIEQKDFHRNVVQLLEENPQISLIAPDIINKFGEHQNPVRNGRIPIKHIIWIFIYSIVIYLIMHIPILNQCVIRYINSRHERNREKNSTEMEAYLHEATNIVPHGAMIIYANEYLHNERNAFGNKTFMYCEEEILYEYCLKKGYMIFYTDFLQIKHLEDISTNSVTVNEVEKKIFVAKHKLYSIGVLIKQRVGIVKCF